MANRSQVVLNIAIQKIPKLSLENLRTQARFVWIYSPLKGKLNFKRYLNILSVNSNDCRNSDIEEQWYWYCINISLF